MFNTKMSVPLRLYILRAFVLCAFVLLTLFSSTVVGAERAKSPARQINHSVSAQEFVQEYYDVYISIEPHFPTVNDVISITSSGEWPNACVPEYKYHQVIDAVIQIYSETPPPETVCAQVFASWSFSIKVGPLPAGNYIVEVYTSPEGFPPSFWDSRPFTVLSEINSMLYLPVVVKP